jgi:hypothetical protein
MKVEKLLTQLKETESYKDFRNENPDAFFCSAMFVIGDADKIDLNFFLPDKNKISSFSMPFASLTNHPEEIKDQKEIKNMNFKIDINNLKQEIENKTKKKFPKLIAILHNGIWNVTCLNGLDMSRITLDAYTGKIKKKDEGSLMEMVRTKKTSEQ